MKRTNYCGLINESYLGQEVIVKGWVHRRRDLGGLVFLDLRDREGILQIVVEPNSSCFNDVLEIRHEFVIEVVGLVRMRPNPNLEIPTGKVEVVANFVKILNSSLPIPILIDDVTTSETNRMTHRIIDLRSQKMQYNLKLRHKVTMEVRNFLDQQGCIDIETPFLTRSTPEGARDFLVPSRIHHGYFYALPQSPQIFKQLLMVAGFDRYYQIVRCFRDEDLRADRQPEFTQIDLETSFLNGSEVMGITEAMVHNVFSELLNIKLPKFPVMTYDDAMYYYGSDKPDLRIDLKFIDLTHVLCNSQFKVFNAVKDYKAGRIVALKLPNTVSLSRKEIDEYTKFAGIYGAKGLAYLKVNDCSKLNEEGLQSPIIKHLSVEELQAIIKETKVQSGETLLFGVDQTKVVNEAMGALRIKIATDKNLVNEGFYPLWVVDFPMFEYDAEENRYMACHHPFTAPHADHLDLLLTDPERCRAQAYDMVLNGSEIGGGSVRIHDSKTQQIVFNALQITEKEAQNKFGFLLDNLQYGAPPHAGLAFGLDRIIAIMCQCESIRDVIAFPKTTRGQCLLTESPNKVDVKQLNMLGIAIVDESLFTD